MASYGEEKLHQLARRLVYGTEQKRVSWSETDRPQAYTSSLGESSVVIATVDDDGQAPFVLLVLDREGEVVDSIQTGNQIAGRSSEDPWSPVLMQLHERARRQAKNVDVVIDDMLRRLPDPDEPPF